MEKVTGNPSVQRVVDALGAANIQTKLTVLSDSARSAKEAADALGIDVGQIASSIVFRLPDDTPLLVITSGRHRVDTGLVADFLNVEKLHRADADFVRIWSGYAIGGVSPVGWLKSPTTIIDEALDDYEIVWAAAGHPHAVFPTSFDELSVVTRARPFLVSHN